jgi:hypothetical protein
MRYLVDVGRLIAVPAVSPRDALHWALLSLGCEGHVNRAAWVYELDRDGNYELGREGKDILRAVPCELEEGKDAA